jgi:hypothetical protein
MPTELKIRASSEDMHTRLLEIISRLPASQANELAVGFMMLTMSMPDFESAYKMLERVYGTNYEALTKLLVASDQVTSVLIEE